MASRPASSAPRCRSGAPTDARSYGTARYVKTRFKRQPRHPARNRDRIETNPALAFMPIRMTTHDEIVVEVDEARAEEAKAILRREMLTLPDWATGLPL